MRPGITAKKKESTMTDSKKSVQYQPVNISTDHNSRTYKVMFSIERLGLVHVHRDLTTVKLWSGLTRGHNFDSFRRE